MTMTVFSSIEGVMVIVKVGHESHVMMRFPMGMERVRFGGRRRLCVEFCDFCVRLSETIFFALQPTKKCLVLQHYKNALSCPSTYPAIPPPSGVRPEPRPFDGFDLIAGKA